MAIQTTPTIPASPAKLKDGTWGARINGQTPVVGATITVTTAGGKKWDASVAAIVWSGAGASIVKTCAVRDVAGTPRPAAPARKTHRAGGRCSDCGGEIQSYAMGGGLCFDCL